MNNRRGLKAYRSILLMVIFLVSELALCFAVSVFKYRTVLLFSAVHFAAFSVILVKRKETFPLPFVDTRSTVAASFAAIFVFCDFYLNAMSIRPNMLSVISTILSRFIPISYENFVIVSSLGLALVSFYALYVIAELIIRNTTVFSVIARTYRRHITVLFSLFCVAYLSIFRANYYYIDDIGRAIQGNGLTGGFSRFLSDVFAEMLHVNVWLADISPITQVVALLILAYTGAVILYIVHGENAPGLLHIVSLIPIGVSPYFLACLSFKYDAPYMAFSILASIVPLLYYRENMWKYGLIVYLATLCMTTTYQASSGIFPACVLLFAFLMWVRGRKIKRIGGFIVVSALGYMSALISFRYLLMAPASNAYVDTSITFRNCFSNMGSYLKMLAADHDMMWKLCVFIVMVVFSICIIASTRRNRFATTALLFVTLSGILVLTYGVNTFFAKPTLDARGVYAIWVLIPVISTITMDMDKKLFSTSAMVILAWMCMVFAIVYGNVLDLQKNYTAYRMEQVLDDINEQKLLDTQEEMELRFTGREGVSSAVKNTIREYPMLKRLLPVLFDDDQGYYWGPKQFCGFYEERLGNVKVSYENDYDMQQYSLVKDTTNYAIFHKQGSVLIHFYESTE